MNEFVIFFYIPGGRNDWKLFYEVAHCSVVQAFLCLFILVINLDFGVTNSLGSIAFFKLSSIGNSHHYFSCFRCNRPYQHYL